MRFDGLFAESVFVLVVDIAEGGEKGGGGGGGCGSGDEDGNGGGDDGDGGCEGGGGLGSGGNGAGRSHKSCAIRGLKAGSLGSCSGWRSRYNE